jgi:hypothetical protein
MFGGKINVKSVLLTISIVLLAVAGLLCWIGISILYTLPFFLNYFRPYVLEEALVGVLIWIFITVAVPIIVMFLSWEIAWQKNSNNKGG